MALFNIGNTLELSLQAIHCIELNEKQFVLIFYQNKFYLLDNLCPHKAAALCEGELSGGEILCPWHKARFDIKSGRGLNPVAGKGVTSWPVHIEHDQLMVNLDPGSLPE